MDVDLPFIAPTTDRFAAPGGDIDVLEIDLGVASRGLAVVVPTAGQLLSAAPTTMNALAGHGYSIVAADLAVGGRGDERVLADLEALVGRMVSRGWTPDQIGLVGHGTGGRAVLLGAMALELAAAVSAFLAVAHTIGVPATVAPVRTPWLGLFGGDEETSRPAVQDRCGALGQGSPHFVEVVGYRADRERHRGSTRYAEFDSWQRTVEWLNLRVGPAPVADGRR